MQSIISRSTRALARRTIIQSFQPPPHLSLARRIQISKHVQIPRHFANRLLDTHRPFNDPITPKNQPLCVPTIRSLTRQTIFQKPQPLSQFTQARSANFPSRYSHLYSNQTGHFVPFFVPFPPCGHSGCSETRCRIPPLKP